MIEILFGESEAASMKAAKCEQIYVSSNDGPTACFGAGKRKVPEKKDYSWIEGNSTEVVCLGFLLDIGDIQKEITGSYRKNLLLSLYNQNQWDGEDNYESELQEMFEHYTSDLSRLQEYLEDCEAVRIWYSDAPYSRCGFYQICQLLLKYQVEVHVVKLSEHVVREDCIVSYANWGEVAAEEFAGFLSYEKILTEDEFRMYAQNWSDLVSENAPLRAVISGQLISVPEDFYDFLIWKHLSDKPRKEARVIGDILGTSMLGVGDWWYAKRIEYYIDRGDILIVEDSANTYARVIKRSSERMERFK